MITDVSKGVSRKFSFVLKNTMDESAVVALFSGIHPSDKFMSDCTVYSGKKEAGVVHSSPAELNNAGYVDVQCVAADGVSLADETNPAAKFLTCHSSMKSKTIRSMREWLRVNSMYISRLQIKSNTREQMDQDIVLATSDPISNYGNTSLTPNSYASPDNYKDNIVNIDFASKDLEIRYDSVVYTKVLSGETVTITFELRPEYESIA